VELLNYEFFVDDAVKVDITAYDTVDFVIEEGVELSVVAINEKSVLGIRREYSGNCKSQCNREFE
jgi:hypothetical protein